MDDPNEWEPVARAVLEELDDVIDRRLAAFRDSLDEWLRGILGGPISSNWRDKLAQFVERTAELGLAITPDSIGVIARIIKSRIVATERSGFGSSCRRTVSRFTADGGYCATGGPKCRRSAQ